MASVDSAPDSVIVPDARGLTLSGMVRKQLRAVPPQPQETFVRRIRNGKLGAVLLLAAAMTAADALTVALLGTGLGAALHVLSHAIGVDLGGAPATDIPVFTALAVLLLVGGGLRWRTSRARPG